MDDFNSSDIEFEQPAKPHFRAGFKSIESMTKTRDEDRKETKKRVRTLQDTRGAPGSIYMRALWLNRLEGYVAMNKISVDSTSGPSAETMMRFIETMVGHIKVIIKGKPAPQLKTMQRGVENLIEALTFKYPKFKLTKHESRRIDTVLDALAKENKLLRGKWSKSQWLGVVVFEKMARAWLQAALDQGCLSWDVHLHKLLSISLVVALCCRTGEVSLGRGYTEEFLRWEHIVLKLRGEEPIIDHLEATIEICFEKAKKKETNDDRSVTLRPLRQSSHNVICAVKLLLIQAFRGGNVKDASSLDDALANASRRLDKTIQWRFPDRPVLPSICRPQYTFLDWEKPASRMQIYNTTVQMGLVAGVLAKINAHQWRKGAARDLAHLKSKISGVADEKVARALGQSRLSLGTGITDNYVGQVDDDLYTARVEDAYENRRGPFIGVPFKKIKLDHKEIAKYCEDNNLDSSSASSRQTARRHLHAAQQSAWLEDEKNSEEPEPEPLAQCTPSQVNAAPVGAKHLQNQGATVAGKSTPAPTTTGRNGDDFLSLIDPRLLLNSGGQGTTLKEAQDVSGVAEEAIQRVMDVLVDVNRLTDNAEQDTDCEMQALGMIVENMGLAEKSSDILLLPGHQFVEAFSKINVVHNTALDPHLTTLDDVWPSKVPMGNSRDYPTLFEFKCPNHTKGWCDYKHPIKGTVNDHFLTCKPKKAETSKPFKCDRCPKGFEKAFAKESGLQDHIRDFHNWVARKCPLAGCPDPARMFQDRKSYANHLAIHHKPIEPTLCTFLGCQSKTVWDTYHLYGQHLRAVHKLMSAEAKAPYLPKQERLSHWPACKCPLGGSTTCATVFKTARELQGHLRSKVHKLTEEDERKIISQMRYIATP